MYVCVHVSIYNIQLLLLYACMYPYTAAARVSNANPCLCMYVCIHIHAYRSSSCTKNTTPSSEKSWALVCGLRTPSGLICPLWSGSASSARMSPFVTSLVCVCVCVHMCMYTFCVYVCILILCVCVYICMHAYLHTHTHTHTHARRDRRALCAGAARPAALFTARQS
jgi:hypothetical protein